ncbi:MAG: hypothetical protein J3K34DRAFT_111252 [Monoraphidium minutum]|nr:MAG: hypothetical protein J3K34DRAFT_111252 [Monoraphidium minutum]
MRSAPLPHATPPCPACLHHADSGSSWPPAPTDGRGTGPETRPPLSAPPYRSAVAGGGRRLLLLLCSQPAARPHDRRQWHRGSPTAGGAGAGAAAPPGKVLLELFVMSLCPDANFCEHFFDKLLETLHPIVHVEARFIGHERASGVTCPHGDSECTANIYQLCVGAYAPAAHNRDWYFKFLVCTWGEKARPDDKSIVATCLDKVGFSDKALRSKIDACIAGPEGKELMRSSAALIKERRAERSCTVFVDGAKRCIRDGGRWYDCPGGSSEEEFTKTICDAHKAKGGAAAPAGVCKAPA